MSSNARQRAATLQNAAVVGVAMLLLSACSTATPDRANSDLTVPSTETYRVEPNPPEPPPTPSTPPPAPPTDPEIMATMECENLDPALLDAMRIHFGTPTRSVQVRVGEGLNEGEIWWVVILDRQADDAYEWGISTFLTNAPGGRNFYTWISLDGADTWGSVEWEGERLVRGQSALEKARECLDI